MGFAGSFLKKHYLLILIALVLAGCAGNTSALKQEKADSLAKLQKVDIRDGENTLAVVILTDRPVGFTTVRVSDPPRMVVELAGADLGEVRQKMKVGKGPVEYIAPSKAPGSSRNIRLEIVLAGPVNSRTAQSGQAINIIFEKQKAEAKAEPAAAVKPAAEAAPAAKAPESAPAVKPQEAAKAVAEPERIVRETPSAKPEQPAAVKAAKPEPPMPEAVSVGGITYEKAAGGYVVKIEGDGKFSKANVFRLFGDRVVIDLPGVTSSKDKFAIDVNGQPLKKIRMARHEGPGKKVRVVLDLGGPADYDVKNNGKNLLVTITSPGSKAAAETAKAAPAPKAEARAEASAGPQPAARKIEAKAAAPGDKPGPAINVYISKADGKTILSSAPIDSVAAVSAAPGGESKNYVETATKIYTGGRISFDIQDADLDKVVKLLADVAGLNLIMDPADVKGKVTLKLDNVPWDQALDILLKIYNLDKVIEGNVLRVAAKAKLDEERRRELLQIAEQKKLEQQAEDLYTKTFKINYTTASDLEPKVKKILSPRGDATANPNTNELIVTDIRDSITKAGEVLALLDKEVNQIMIEARILTVDVGYSQSLGISWGFQRTTLNKQGGTSGWGLSSGPNSGQKFTEGDPSYQLTVPAEFALGAGGGVGTLLLGNIIRDANIDLTIQALEAINKAEVLAAPKVFTLENQSANIVSGTTLYVQTTSASGTKPEPLNANLSLTVNPRVTGNNYIMMQVTATNNQPSTPPPGSTAAISTQAVNTNVLVKDGDTIVLGGIYTKSKSHGDSHIPLLGRIPIIKYLFSTNTWSDTTSELLIFITPKLVKQSRKI